MNVARGKKRDNVANQTNVARGKKRDNVANQTNVARGKKGVKSLDSYGEVLTPQGARGFPGEASHSAGVEENGYRFPLLLP
ncbi:hypothetical protein ACOMHN_052952 [Nucella lapillus]